MKSVSQLLRNTTAVKMVKRAVFLFATALALSVVSSQVIVTVPDYGVLNGTEETSVNDERPFYGFRGVFYAEQPTAETRFLVTNNKSV